MTPYGTIYLSKLHAAMWTVLKGALSLLPLSPQRRLVNMCITSACIMSGA